MGAARRSLAWKRKRVQGIFPYLVFQFVQALGADSMADRLFLVFPKNAAIVHGPADDAFTL